VSDTRSEPTNGPAAGKTLVLIVEDQRAISDALTLAIDSQPDLECVGAAGTIDEALTALTGRAPDVVLMDVHLPGTDGIDGTIRLKAICPGTRVVMLTADDDPAVMARAAEAGAAGFLLKYSSLKDVLAAIREAREGGMLVGAATLSAVMARVTRTEAKASPPHNLTPRELEILGMLAGGLDARAIAKTLTLSLHTVRGHVKSVLAKMEVHSQLEAVVAATRRGIIA